VEGDYKRKQIQQSLTRAVDLYLSQGYDETGYCYVKDLTLSKDGRRATALVAYQNDPGDVAIDKARLTEIIKKQVRLRFVPKVEFIKIIDESR
jgi:ribosome-binding factor A